MKTFKGSGVALVTPFLSDGSIDFQALQQLVSLQIKGGTDFLVVQGTTGESPTLSQDEKRKVLDTVLEVNNGQLPVVYGIGGNNTAGLAALFQNLPSGVDGILSVSPYYNKPIQKGIVAHFKQVASFTDLPIILYNVPGRTGSNMSVETTLELAEIQNVVAVKEASGNMEQIMDIIRQRKPGFGVLSGDDNLTMPLIAAGADGVISVVANAFPERFSQMVHASMEGNLALAKAAHYDLFNVTKMFFEEGNPGGVKVALTERGLMQETMRMPLYPVSAGLRSRIQAETKRLLASH
ncbi:MAG: 4-hydroxy-tetrahydrodipicolinate synthase [Crocinitomicaceae bacterium]|jgi:4-hydroxy-tetrahydrodipicolinate synthase|nr:4-hydroxy-tetrahydrodipicolinate synthase [Crocinitomicaceae bacterium]MDP5041900.1 4-hydroxy-tetrahydrodipicolinate synthase [Crocinitomicaceae bacterium]MDP5066716.1 4-hydroxy-tetrahydrodipicolinate synthase [Crocinitomicaceae bacterium]